MPRYGSELNFFLSVGIDFIFYAATINYLSLWPLSIKGNSHSSLGVGTFTNTLQLQWRKRGRRRRGGGVLLFGLN